MTQTSLHLTSEIASESFLQAPETRNQYNQLKAEILAYGAALAECIDNLGRSLKRMKETNLYLIEFSNWEAFCENLEIPGMARFGRRRADQIIMSYDAQLHWISEHQDQPDFTDIILSWNERTIREIRGFSPAEQLQIVGNICDEIQDVGRTPTSGLVKQVAEELSTYKFDEIQAMFGLWGTFKRYSPANAKTKRMRYVFSRVGHVHLFANLNEAVEWHKQNCHESNQITHAGCLNCIHGDKDERCGVNEIWCCALNYEIGYEFVWAKPDQCNRWTDGQRKIQYVPQVIDVTPSEHPGGVLAKGAGRGDKDPERDERYTPEYLWRPGLDMTGKDAYDLDPGTSDKSPVPALLRYTRENSGLINPWKAEVMFANFPFSLNLKMALKFIEEWLAGNIGTAILVLKTDHRTQWYNTLLREAIAVCLVDHPVKYLNSEKNSLQSSFFGTTIFYFGPSSNEFRKHHQHLGVILKPSSLLRSTPIHFTKYTAQLIRSMWADIPDMVVEDYPKYHKSSGFMATYPPDDVHLDFQNQKEAWNSWDSYAKKHLRN